MYAKVSSLAIVLFLSGIMLGGCPAPVDDNGNLDTTGSSLTNPDNDSGTADNSNTDGSDDNADNASDDNAADDNNASDSGDDANASDANGDDNDADGDANDNDAGGDPDPVFTGTYAGTWTRVKREALGGGALGGEQEWTTQNQVTFNADGLPVSFIIPGYQQAQNGIDFVAAVNQVGDTVTLTETDGDMTYTLQVTVALVNYGETTGRVVLNLVHHGEGNNAAQTQDGTGVQVIEYSLVGGQLEYSSVVTYNVAVFNGGIDTTWEVTCEGTLAAQ